MDEFLESSFSDVDFLEMDDILQSTITEDVGMLPQFPDATFPIDQNLQFPLPIKDECLTPQHQTSEFTGCMKSYPQTNLNGHTEPMIANNGNEILKSMLSTPVTETRQNCATTSNEEDFQFWFEYRDFQFNPNDSAPSVEPDYNLSLNDIVPFQHDQILQEQEVVPHNSKIMPDSNMKSLNKPVERPIANFQETKKKKPSQPRLPKYMTKFNIHDNIYKCVFSCKHCGRIFTTITASQNHHCDRRKRKAKPTQTLPNNPTVLSKQFNK